MRGRTDAKNHGVRGARECARSSTGGGDGGGRDRRRLSLGMERCRVTLSRARLRAAAAPAKGGLSGMGSATFSLFDPFCDGFSLGSFGGVEKECERELREGMTSIS